MEVAQLLVFKGENNTGRHLHSADTSQALFFAVGLLFPHPLPSAHAPRVGQNESVLDGVRGELLPEDKLGLGEDLTIREEQTSSFRGCQASSGRFSFSR